MFPKRSKYPKYIYFGDERYSLKFVKRLGCYGETNWEKKTIKVKSGMSSHQTFRTIIHELLHLIEFEKPLKLKHKLIYNLEEAIFELILANFL